MKNNFYINSLVATGMTQETAIKLEAYCSSREFNLPAGQDDTAIWGADPARVPIVLVKSEVSMLRDRIEQEAQLHADELAELARTGEHHALEAAEEKLEAFIDGLRLNRRLMTDEEKEYGSKLRKEINRLRNIASSRNPELAQRKAELMSQYGIRTVEKFDPWAERVGLEPGSIEAEHMRLITPVSVLRKLGRQDYAEAVRIAQEDARNEVDRSTWNDLRPDGYSYLEYEKEHSTREDKARDEERAIVRSFEWLGVDREYGTYQDIGAQLLMSGYTPLFSYDVCKDRLERILGSAPESILAQMMLTPERLAEAKAEDAARANWRHELHDLGTVDSFDYDAYILGWGRQKNISWPKLGGTFASAWGCRLIFEASAKGLREHPVYQGVPAGQEEPFPEAVGMSYVDILKGITRYDVDAEGKVDPMTTYKYVKALLRSQAMLRPTKGQVQKDLPAFYRTMIEHLCEQNAKFSLALPLIECCDLPKAAYDPDGFNAAWNQALLDGVEVAKHKNELRAQQAVVNHDYSDLEDCYGEEMEVLADSILQELKREALKAARGQAAFLGDREYRLVEDEESCDF